MLYRSLVLFCLLFLTSAPPATGCADRFLELERYAERLDDPAVRYAEKSRKYLYRSSDELTEKLREASLNGKPEKVNLVVIGGGPHAAELFSSYHATNPSLKAVVFEGSGEVGTFDRFGMSFALNSKEAPGATGNPIYGSTIPMRLFNPKGEIYAPAEAMGDATLLAHRAARTPLAFHQWVTSIAERPEGADWPGRYLVTTRDRISVYTDAVVAAPGMGQPAIRVEDANSLALAAKEIELAKKAKSAGQTYVPLIEPLDDTLERARNFARQGEDFLELYEPGERIGIVGGNYGSMISVETFSGTSPERLYPKGTANGDRVKLVWIGQESKNFQDFQGNNSNPRYWPTVQKPYERNQITNVPGHVVSWRPTTPEEAHLGRLAIMLEGRPEPVYVDRIVTGTGYENKVNDLYGSLIPKELPAEDRARALSKTLLSSHLDQDFPHATSAEVPISRQIQINGRAQEIFEAGQATNFTEGKEIPEQEWKNAKGGFLDVLGRRTEALGRELARRAGPSEFKPEALHSAAPGTSRRVLSLALPPLSKAPAEKVTAELDLRIALQHALYGWELPHGGILRFSLRGGTEPKLITKSLDEKSAEKLKDLLENDLELSHAITNYLKLSGGNATLSLKTKTDGRPIFESLLISRGTRMPPVMGKSQNK